MITKTHQTKKRQIWWTIYTWVFETWMHLWITGWWFGTCLFSHIIIGNVIIPIDELIFLREVGLNHQPYPWIMHRLSIDYPSIIQFFGGMPYFQTVIFWSLHPGWYFSNFPTVSLTQAQRICKGTRVLLPCHLRIPMNIQVFVFTLWLFNIAMV